MAGVDPGTSRRRLFAVAYRMLGSGHDAEDVVQEAFVRWERLTAAEREAIRTPQAWFTTVVSRLCLDHLGSARMRREEYAGVWLPEPLPGSVDASAPPDPADVVTLEESVSVALLVVMESMTPAERVAFVLHDVFGLSFAEVAQVVGRTPQACRQLASSARRRVHEQRRYALDGPGRDRVVAAFALACAEGDVRTLASVLAPDVVARSDGGGVVSAARQPVRGADAVARFLVGITTKAWSASWRALFADLEDLTVTSDLVPVNGQTGLLVRVGGRPAAVVALAVAGDRVAEVDLVLNPQKLSAWR